MTFSTPSKRIFGGPKPVDDIPRRRPAPRGTGHPVCSPLDSRPIEVADDGDSLGAKLRAKIATLKTNPQRCPIDPDSEVYGEEVRVLLHGKRSGVYRVLFLIRRSTVHVLTVRRSAQRRSFRPNDRR